MQNLGRLAYTFMGIICLCLVVSLYPQSAFAQDNPSARPLEQHYEEASDLSEASSFTFSGADISDITVSEEAREASSEGCIFAISDFSQYNKGTNKDYEGQYFGYRFPAQGEDAFSVVVFEGYTLVYLPHESTEKLEIDIADTHFQEEFIAMLQSLDEASSLGGTLQSSLDQPYYFTHEKTIKAAEILLCFGVALDPEHFYTSVSKLGSNDGSGEVLYCESGKLVSSQDVAIAAPASGIESMQQFLTNLDYRPLWVSMKTSGVALLFIFIFGLLAAWATIKASSRFKGIFDTIFTIPMVLPPTVCGFLLLMLFGTSTGIGQWLIEHGIDIVFTWPAAVIACVVVGFPLMYRATRGAFENLDPNMLDAARTLGWSEQRIFFRLMVPLAWPSIAAGTILAFARAMGEFGATLFFAGNYAGITQTIPLAIYFQWMGGNTDVAIFWVIVVIIISFLVIMLINVYSSRTQRYRRGGSNELEG